MPKEQAIMENDFVETSPATFRNSQGIQSRDKLLGSGHYAATFEKCKPGLVVSTSEALQAFTSFPTEREVNSGGSEAERSRSPKLSQRWRGSRSLFRSLLDTARSLEWIRLPEVWNQLFVDP
jgi:hypothetical protein